MLLEPQGPQAGVQRHTAVHIVDILPYVQILDVPVPQLGEELVDFMQKLDTLTPEQFIEVPQLSHDSIPQRSALRRPQMAEQLVEVPTVLSYALLQQHAAEQIIDIPVPGSGGGGGGGLQGFSSGQNSTARLVEQNNDIQVRRCRRRSQGGLPGSHPGQGSTAGVSEQIDDIPIRGGPQGFLPKQGMQLRTVEQIVEIPVHAGGGPHLLILGLQAHPHFRVMSLGIGIYARLHWMSEVRVPPGVRVRGCTDTRAHGRWRLMSPRSRRTRTSSTSSSTTAASHG